MAHAARQSQINSKSIAGTVPAPEIEGIIEDTVRRKLYEQDTPTEAVWDRIERAVVSAKSIRVTLSSNGTDAALPETINIPWTSKKPNRPDTSTLAPSRGPDQKLLQAFVRAQAWLSDLASNRSSSIEELASNADIHPKVMREALKLAFLAPDIVTSIFAGEAMFELVDLRNVSALSWQSQREELHQRLTQQPN